MTEAGVGAAEVLGHAAMLRREALDVELVDDRVVQRSVGTAIVAPLEEWIDDDRFRHEGRAVLFIGWAIGIVVVVPEHGLVPHDLAFNGVGVGIEQQLRRMAAQAVVYVVRAHHAVAITLARQNPGKIRMPDERISLDHRHRLLLQLFIEQAELYLDPKSGVHREVGADTIEGGSQWIRAPWPTLQLVLWHPASSGRPEDCNTLRRHTDLPLLDTNRRVVGQNQITCRNWLTEALRIGGEIDRPGQSR